MHIILLWMCPPIPDKHQHVPSSWCTGILGNHEGMAVCGVSSWPSAHSLHCWWSFEPKADSHSAISWNFTTIPKTTERNQYQQNQRKKIMGVECQPWSTSGPMGKANVLSPIQPWFSTKKESSHWAYRSSTLSFHSFYHASPRNIPTFTTCWQVNSSNSWIRARIT